MTRAGLTDYVGLHERTPRRELALQMLKKSLKANPPFEEPKTLLPVEEAEIRRDFAIKLEAEIRTNPLLAHFRLNAVQVATILSVPISTLRPGGYLSLRDSGGQQNSTVSVDFPLFVVPGGPELLLGDDDSDKPDFRTMKWVEDQQSQQATLQDVQMSGSTYL
ncbi:hypothetical protein N0V84_003513 [Fusarium piperis]|uniref:Uncharacterized protein n=1 Tax=Fusarium piperis TaxID=1435070 RepID=A0A9W8WHC3_9HYPO|nr:hypothetical protein N0V84_003513 [Fusarium piperis]